jgi:hypothetical protein
LIEKIRFIMRGGERSARICELTGPTVPLAVPMIAAAASTVAIQPVAPVARPAAIRSATICTERSGPKRAISIGDASPTSIAKA